MARQAGAGRARALENDRDSGFFERREIDANTAAPMHHRKIFSVVTLAPISLLFPISVTFQSVDTVNAAHSFNSVNQSINQRHRVVFYVAVAASVRMYIYICPISYLCRVGVCV